MFKDLKWEAIERAYSLLVERQYKPSDYLVVFVKLGSDNTVRRSNITVEHFKTRMWDLFSSNRIFNEIAVVDPKGDNSVIFCYNTKKKIDEGMPTLGDGNVVKFWKTYDTKRREALLQILAAQIREETNERTE